MKVKIGMTVLVVIFALANSSCEYTGTQISKRVIIKVVNSEGKNMFDSNTKNAINIDSIRIYRRLANGDTIAAEKRPSTSMSSAFGPRSRSSPTSQSC